MRKMARKALRGGVAVSLNSFCIWVTFDVAVRSSIEGSWSALDFLPKVPTNLFVFFAICFCVTLLAFVALLSAERLERYDEGRDFSVSNT